MARERERERDTDDSDSVHDVLSFLHRKVAKSKKYKNMFKELKRANQKLKAEKYAMEKDEKEKRTKVISEKEELAQKVERHVEENAQLRSIAVEHARGMNKLANANQVQNENLQKKTEENNELQEEVMKARQVANSSAHIRLSSNSAPARAQVTTVPGPTVQAASIVQYSMEKISLRILLRSILLQLQFTFLRVRGK